MKAFKLLKRIQRGKYHPWARFYIQTNGKVNESVYVEDEENKDVESPKGIVKELVLVQPERHERTRIDTSLLMNHAVRELERLNHAGTSKRKMPQKVVNMSC